MKSKGERSDIQVDAVFDIETSHWTEFVCGGVYYAKDNAYEAYDWKHEDSFFDALLSVRSNRDTMGCVWSHNGGRFDIKWALDHAVKREIPCDAVAAGSNIIIANIGGTRFLDSKALTKISLEELTHGASVAKEKLGLECTGSSGGCVEEPGECRGYCAISRTMPRAMLTRLLQYLEGDCRSLYEALQRVREYAGKNNLDLGVSVGSAAWKCAKRWLELPRAQLAAAEHKFARQGYFGGRVQIFQPQASRGFEYDVNSMYPSRLAFEKVPIGPARNVSGDVCGRAFDSLPGIYRARVYVPPVHVPVLPVKLGTRSCYPTGFFTGTWTRPELQYAVECGAARIEKFEEALVWPHEQVLFEPWVRKVFELRAEALGWDGKPNKKGPLGTWLKFYANSLTGKFGSNPKTERVVINPSLDQIKCCVCKPAWLKFHQCECDAWLPVSSFSNCWLSPKWFIQPCAHVEWGAYLTAQARVEWHKQAVSVSGGYDLCYGDTDSVFTTLPRSHNLGTDLGQWKPEEEWTNGEWFAPKVYRIDNPEAPKVKGKGLKLPRMVGDDGKPKLKAIHTAEHLIRQSIKEGVGIGKEAVIGFKAGVHLGKFFETDTIKRRVSIGYGDRFLDGKVTRAPTISEACAKWGSTKLNIYA